MSDIVNENILVPSDSESKLTSAYAVNMMSIANNDIKAIDIGSAEQAKNQISMFLVAQAKNELYRIIKLTSFLEEVEARYIDTATELMQQYPDNLTLVQNVLETIEKSINRSNELLTQVLKDDKLNTYVFNFHSKNDNESAVYKNLDKASRDDLRVFATKMLDNGADLRVIQELLGHASISATQIYTHVSTKKMSETFEKYHPHSKRNIKIEEK